MESPSPVGGVAGGELDAVALDAAGGVQVGAGAQVGELALLVEGDDGVLGQVVDKLYLIGFVLLLHELHGLGPGQLKALQLQLFLADLPHLGFQLGQLGLGEGFGGVKVVVKPVLNGRADGQLHLGMEALHGLGQHVGAGVPVGLFVVGIFKGVQILVSHGMVPPGQIWGMGIKNPPLEILRGGIGKTISRFHPACMAHGGHAASFPR